LYKYYPPERIDVFEKWALRFTAPAHFNDIFDTDYSIHDRRDTKRKLKDRSGLAVFCLTEDADNHLMWVNYAAQHTGFVLAFDPTDEFFAEAGGVLRKVEYRDAPPDMTFHSDPPLDLCFIKSKDWEYEQEWRCVRQITKGEITDVTLPHMAIREIIMGWSITRPARIALLDAVDSIGQENPISVSESTPDRHTWAFGHEKTKHRLCAHCGGLGTLRDKG